MTGDATRAAPRRHPRAAKPLTAGDLFFPTSRATAGGWTTCRAGTTNSTKWCLYDGGIDRRRVVSGRAGSRRVRCWCCRTCHSGTVTRAQRIRHSRPAAELTTARNREAGTPNWTTTGAAAVMQARSPRHRRSGRGARVPPPASVAPDERNRRRGPRAADSGCQDNQTSMDGDHSRAFTEQLLKVWNQGGYRGNYASSRGDQGADASVADAQPISLGPAAASFSSNSRSPCGGAHASIPASSLPRPCCARAASRLALSSTCRDQVGAAIGQRDWELRLVDGRRQPAAVDAWCGSSTVVSSSTRARTPG